MCIHVHCECDVLPPEQTQSFYSEVIINQHISLRDEINFCAMRLVVYQDYLEFLYDHFLIKRSVKRILSPLKILFLLVILFIHLLHCSVLCVSGKGECHKRGSLRCLAPAVLPQKYSAEVWLNVSYRCIFLNCLHINFKQSYTHYALAHIRAWTENPLLRSLVSQKTKPLPQTRPSLMA